MDVKYKPGDMVILNTKPHNGTVYPAALREYVENGKPVEIRDCGNDVYYINIHGNSYAIYIDEILGVQKQTYLFI